MKILYPSTIGKNSCTYTRIISRVARTTQGNIYNHVKAMLQLVPFSHGSMTGNIGHKCSLFASENHKQFVVKPREN